MCQLVKLYEEIVSLTTKYDNVFNHFISAFSGRRISVESPYLSSRIWNNLIPYSNVP